MMLRTPAGAAAKDFTLTKFHIILIAAKVVSLSLLSSAHVSMMQCIPFAGATTHRGEDTRHNGILRPPVKGDSCDTCSLQLLASFSGTWDPKPLYAPV